MGGRCWAGEPVYPSLLSVSGRQSHVRDGYVRPMAASVALTVLAGADIAFDRRPSIMLQPRRLGYNLDVARAVAFHCMAIGLLLVTYFSRLPWARPLPNVYLPVAVLGEIGIQLTAAWLPYSAGLLRNASIPIAL